MTEPRRRKVWQHDIENISENQISEHFHSIGWVVGRLEKDYGEDLFIRIFEEGVFIGKAFYVQLKGTNNIQQYALKTNVFSYQVEVEDLLQWHRNKLPVIFVLWDIEQRKGYWLHIKSYVDKKLEKDPTWLEQEKGKGKRNIHIPFAQAISGDGENALIALVKAEPPLWHVLDGAQQVLNDADPHYRLEAHLTSTGTQITTVEKYPGAYVEKPINIKFKTVIPTNTEEGRSLAEQVKQFHDSGVPVKIPFPYIKDLEFPAFIRQALPEFTEDGFFLLGTAQNPNPLLLRFEFTADDGEQFMLEYVHLKVVQAGKEEVTFTNEDQPLPIKVKLVLRSNGTIETDFDTPYTPHVHWLLKQLQLQNCLSKLSTVRLISIDTGIPIVTVKRVVERSDAPLVWSVQAIEALNAFQIKARKQITFPDRELIEEELRMLELLRRIFHEGKVEVTWNSLCRTVSVSPETIAEVRQFITPFAEGKISKLPIRFEETVSLFDVELPLGEISPIQVQARLANEQQVLEKLAEQKECEISLQFVPGGDPTYVKEYLDWIKP